jgi:hypothetical protein
MQGNEWFMMRDKKRGANPIEFAPLEKEVLETI